jgi:hypothetical protein
VVPDVYNAFTPPHIQTSMFIWTYLHCYWRYREYARRVILQTWSQIQRTTSGSGYVNYGLEHLQWIYYSVYWGFNNRLNVSALLLEISRQFNARYTAGLVPNTVHSPQFTLCVLWSGHIQCYYSSAYSGFNIQLNVSALILETFRHFDARYTANLVPYIAHNNQFALCELWSRPYTMHLQVHIFRHQYSFERICPAIVHITTIQCAIYCKLVAKYSAHPPVYTMWTVVPAIYKVLTAPHI